MMEYVLMTKMTTPYDDDYGDDDEDGGGCALI